jgi:hypothetical protein
MADGKIIVIHVDGRQEVIPVKESPEFSELQNRVRDGEKKGHVTIVRGANKYDGQSCITICDEDAPAVGAMVNSTASAIFNQILYGPVVVLIGGAKKGLK